MIPLPKDERPMAEHIAPLRDLADMMQEEGDLQNDHFLHMCASRIREIIHPVRHINLSLTELSVPFGQPSNAPPPWHDITPERK